MSLLITSRPQQSQLVRFVAAGNPLIYNLQRRDYAFNQINNSAGFMQVQFNGINLTAAFPTNSSVYVQSDDQSHDLNTTVTAAAFSAGNTLVTMAAAFISNPGTGYVNNNTTRANYRVEIQWGNSTFVYSPTSRGYVQVNVTWSKYFIDIYSTTPFYQTNDATIEPTAIAFYLRYKEVWTGSAEVQVQDNANTLYPVYGARQVGEDHVLTEYNDNNLFRKFLTFLTRPVAWRNYAFAISFVHDLPGGITVNAIKKRYLNGALLDNISYGLVSIVGAGVYSFAFTETGTADKVELQIQGITPAVSLGNPDFTATLVPWVNTAPGAVAWASVANQAQAVLGAGPSDSQFLRNILSVPLTIGMKYQVVVVGTMTGAGIAQTNFVVWFWDGANRYQKSAAVGAANFGYTFSFIADRAYTHIEIKVDNGGAAVTVNVDSVTPSALDVLTEVKTIDIKDACDNPVYLSTKNNLGGCLFWMFDFNQLKSVDYKDAITPLMKLTAEFLKAEEWEALQDFIGIGDTYRKNFTQLSATNRTNERIGKQVYTVGDDISTQRQTSRGVIVAPTKNSRLTRKFRTAFELNIELPETQQA